MTCDIQVAPVDPYPLLGLSYLILTLWTLWVAFRDVPKHYYVLHLQVKEERPTRKKKPGIERREFERREAE